MPHELRNEMSRFLGLWQPHSADSALALSSTAYCIEDSLTDDTYSVIISGVETCDLPLEVRSAFSFPETRNFATTRPTKAKSDEYYVYL